MPSYVLKVVRGIRLHFLVGGGGALNWKLYLEIARLISHGQNKTWECWIAGQFLFQSLFQANTMPLPKSAGGDGFCEVCFRPPHLEILVAPENSIYRIPKNKWEEMIPSFLIPCSVTKAAGSLSHAEVVAQLYYRGKAEVSNFLTSASSFTFSFSRTVTIMTFWTIWRLSFFLNICIIGWNSETLSSLQISRNVLQIH